MYNQINVTVLSESFLGKSYLNFQNNDLREQLYICIITFRVIQFSVISVSYFSPLKKICQKLGDFVKNYQQILHASVVGH